MVLDLIGGAGSLLWIGLHPDRTIYCRILRSNKIAHVQCTANEFHDSEFPCLLKSRERLACDYSHIEGEIFKI